MVQQMSASGETLELGNQVPTPCLLHPSARTTWNRGQNACEGP